MSEKLPSKEWGSAIFGNRRHRGNRASGIIRTKHKESKNCGARERVQKTQRRQGLPDWEGLPGVSAK